MTVYEALSILEISGSYDEKRLKIVYRKLGFLHKSCGNLNKL